MSINNSSKTGVGDLNKILAQTAMEIHRTHSPEVEGVDSAEPMELAEAIADDTQEITEEQAIADLTEWLDGIVNDVESQLNRELSEEELDYTLDHAISLLETEEEIESAE